MTPADDPGREQLDRRAFLARAAKAGAALGIAGVGAYLLHDSSPPASEDVPSGITALPDFSVKVSPRMAIAHGADRAATVGAALSALGGIEQFIKRGDKVLLKVNAAFATPPILSATSHPSLVAEVTRLCLKAGAAEVRVSDNPINDPDSCFRLTGIAEAVENAGGKLILPRSSAFRPITIKEATLIRNWPLLAAPLEGITKLIGIAPIKDHHRSGASMTMKNWYGLLGGRRNVFHQDINTIITELALMVKPTLVILDGTSPMMSNGPTGGSMADLRQTNLMIVGTDQVAADAFGSTLLDRKPTDFAYIGRAAEAGAGTLDYESLKPHRVEVA